MGILTSTTPKTKPELLFSESWVDVRDVALAHALALEKPLAGGERIIIAAGKLGCVKNQPADYHIDDDLFAHTGPFVWQEWRELFVAVTLTFISLTEHLFSSQRCKLPTIQPSQDSHPVQRRSQRTGG